MSRMIQEKVKQQRIKDHKRFEACRSFRLDKSWVPPRGFDPQMKRYKCLVCGSFLFKKPMETPKVIQDEQETLL